MENIDTKIKTVSDEINCICDEHEISEELVLKCAKLIKNRNNLKFQKKNEVWVKRNPQDITIDIDEFREYHLPETVKVAIHYQPNRNNWLFEEIQDVFDVDVCDIYDYSYTEEVDKEYEDMCQKYNPQDPEFIIWCLKRKYPEKRISHIQYNGCSQGDVYDCFFMCDNDANISKEIAIVRDYCEGNYEQYDKSPDECDNMYYEATVFNTYLSELNTGKIRHSYLDDEDLVKHYLKSVSGTDRNIVLR